MEQIKMKITILLLGIMLIGLVSAASISFISPTPQDQSHSVNTYIYVNTSYLEPNFVNVTFNLLDSNEVVINSSTYLTPINFSNYTSLSEGLYQIQVILYDNVPSYSSTEMRKIAVSSSSGTYVQPLDFKTIFIGYFLGNPALFPFAFIILLSLVCGYFGMSNKVFLVILTIGAVMFGSYLGEPVYFLTLFLAGFIIFYSFSKIFSR